MKVTFLVTGKTSEKYLETGIEQYAARLSHYARFSIKVTTPVKDAGKLPASILKVKEGEAILKEIGRDDYLVLLDEKGKEFSSLQFADFLQARMNQSVSHLVFCIGGAFGFSPEVYKRADQQLSLSRMTFSHQLIRLIFAEQLYRAFTILKGESYHHE